MNSFEIRLLEPTEFPPLLAEIPQPPKELWAVGTLPTSDLKLLAVVGSRKYTTYGKQVIEKIIGCLRSEQGKRNMQVMLSVFQTWRLQGLNPYKELRAIV